MPSIKNSDFVKSRHIQNIVSESAKIAIRDYIDSVTLQSNSRIERISEMISHNMGVKLEKAGKVIPDLISLKGYVLELAE